MRYLSLTNKEANFVLVTVRTVKWHAENSGSRAPNLLDAPVSGGVGGAQAGTLTFMVLVFSLTHGHKHCG